MIKIGDFSKLAHVSIKTLHHYGDMGLLKPAHVDRWNGYRYYTLDQLPRLNRILALKELGFSLEEIAQLLDENLSVAEMRGMLRMKRRELEKTVQAEQARLLSVEHRLIQLEQEHQPPSSEIAIKEVPAQTVLMARAVASNEDAILPARQSLQELLHQQLSQARLKPATPWFALIDDLPYAETDLEIAMAVGIHPRQNQRAGDWQGTPITLTELPEVPNMASIIHEGSVATLPRAYAHLYAWTQTHGYNITGICREIYLPETGINSPTEPGLGTEFTEVQCPVQRASIPISILSPEKRKETTMEPKIITKPGFKAVGLSYVGKNENGEIPQMWGVFNHRMDEITSDNETCCYGLCFSSPDGAAEGEFEYVAASEVANDQNIPEGMVYREVPAYKYAVFTHHGKLDTLGETYEYIYNTWLPQAGLELHPDKYDMEVYTDEFELGSDDSKFYIYVAIQ